MRLVKIEIDLPQFFLLGQSFGICRELHLWPPISTVNKFLERGIQDVDGVGGGPDYDIMTWEAFELSREEYEEALHMVDPSSRIDSLETDDGDWYEWFESAVRRLEKLRGR